MTDDRTLERVARSWLEDGPTRAPEHTVAGALAQIQTTQQERGFAVPWRFSSMTPMFKVAGAALVAVIAIGSFLSLSRPPGGTGGDPSPTPTASPSPTTAPSPTENLGACRLLTSSEAADMAGDPGLGALPSQSGAGDVTTCLYSDGGGDSVLRITYHRSGGAAALAAFQAGPDVEAVGDIGDAAAFSPSTGELFVLSGNAAFSVVAPGDAGPVVLPVLRGIAEVILPRL
jgi:hypothetical protein